jgi:outer membrane protein W
MLRNKTWLAVVGIAFILLPASARAQSQVMNFSMGYFSVLGESSRVAGDALIADLSDAEPLYFNVGDFSGFTFGAEWLIGLNHYLDAGVGASYYQHTVHSIYANSVYPDGSEITQDLKLRIAPITATVHVYPMGKNNGIQPYIGGGIGIFPYHYSEVGNFIDTSDNSIFYNQYVKDGTAFGPVFLGGVRAPAGSALMLGGEVRYQHAHGDLPLGGVSGFLGDKIDLSGWTWNVTMGVRF